MKRVSILILALVALCGCSKKENSISAGDGTELGFALAGVSTEVLLSGQASVSSKGDVRDVVRAGTDLVGENLEAGVTVRVLAYQRRDGGVAADIEQDLFVEEATYQVQDDGSLKACTVNASGEVTATTGPAMRLRAGVYDFYALTPALPLIEYKRVSVAHGTDYACSLTAGCGITVQEPTVVQTVELSVLERRCSQINFSITRKAENVAEAVIESAELSGIGRSPAEAVLCQPLPTGTNDGTYVFPPSIFKQEAEPYRYSGTDEVLPKSNAAYDLAMKVVFNGADEASALQATIPAMAFDPGKRYNFNVSLQGDFIVLSLQITPWNTDAVWDAPDVGEPPYATFVVETWEISEWTTDVAS